jgi:predicted DNA-binding transcriptional regulator AlpA
MNILTAEEVAAKLKVHVKTVYANREIPRVEISPGVVRFCEADVEAWVRSKVTRKAKPDKRLRAAPVSNFMRHSENSKETA